MDTQCVSIGYTYICTYMVAHTLVPLMLPFTRIQVIYVIILCIVHLFVRTYVHAYVLMSLKKSCMHTYILCTYVHMDVSSISLCTYRVYT